MSYIDREGSVALARLNENSIKVAKPDFFYGNRNKLDD